MAGMLKLYDKLLFLRVKDAHAESPWQGGVHEGANVTAWLASSIVAMWRAQNPGKNLFAAFLDGEAAFCRPPSALVLEEVWAARV